MQSCTVFCLASLRPPACRLSSFSDAAAPAHLPHAPHDAELLRVDEALQHHPDGHVDVVLQHVVPQVHLGVGLGHADHGLDVANGDGDAARGLWTRSGTRRVKQRKRSGPEEAPVFTVLNTVCLSSFSLIQLILKSKRATGPVLVITTTTRTPPNPRKKKMQ